LNPVDIAAIAEEIRTPYQTVPLVSLGAIDVKLVICGGRKPWHRSTAHNELALVLEGVVTLDGPKGRTIASEGEMALVPAKMGFAYASGMRSTVVLFQERDLAHRSNGHHKGPSGQPELEVLTAASRIAFGTDVRSASPFEWLATGEVGSYDVFSTRLSGESAPYDTPAGGMVVLVYRGVVDYHADEESGSIIGSQLLHVPEGTRLTLASERGATVVLLTRRGAALPHGA
jgi:hypothetical protein